METSDGEVRLLIDTRFYGYLTVLRAAKLFTRTCFVYMDGDPSDKVIVGLKPKASTLPLENYGYEFYNCMLGIMSSSIRNFKQSL
ncbi:MAG: hypothetical protein ABIG95_06715 [Candidatus Woesearchaeota archaeon]